MKAQLIAGSKQLVICDTHLRQGLLLDGLERGLSGLDLLRGDLRSQAALTRAG